MKVNHWIYKRVSNGTRSRRKLTYVTIQTKHAVVLLSNITINSGLEVALVEVLKPMANTFKLT